MYPMKLDTLKSKYPDMYGEIMISQYKIDLICQVENDNKKI